MEDMTKARELFRKALSYSSASRPAFLAGACGEDHELRRIIEEWLLEHERMEDSVTLEASRAGGVLEEAGESIGPYKLLQKIGEGAFGLVYLAEQREPIRRKVALKIIKPGMDTGQILTRFERERQALGVMDHPNIAKVFDGGATQSGHPYFVMEYARGEPITQFLNRNKIPLDERLEVFIQVCRAIGHAHQKGVIHRDIKPGNVLVTDVDGHPRVKVIDFGIAKATAQEFSFQTALTERHQLMGSPAYMSPEQADPGALDVDFRSDIYSLGALLYEILTGNTPLDSQELMVAGYEEMADVIRRKEPLRPSVLFQRMSSEERAQRWKEMRQDASKRRSAVARELDWIVMRALEKDRERRYGSAQELLSDLENYRKDLPVTAAPPSFGYRWAKAAKRYPIAFRTALSLSLLLALAMTCASAMSLWAFRAKNEAERLAKAETAALEIQEDAIRESTGTLQKITVQKSTVDSKLGDYLMKRADREVKEARLQDAGKTLESVSEDHREQWDWLRLKAIQEVFSGEEITAETVQRIDRVLDLEPDNAPLVVEMAALLFDKYPERSIALMQRAVELEPNRAEFRVLLICALYQSGAFDKVVGAYEAALEQLAESKDIDLSLFHIFTDWNWPELKAPAGLESFKSKFLDDYIENLLESRNVGTIGKNAFYRESWEGDPESGQRKDVAINMRQPGDWLLKEVSPESNWQSITYRYLNYLRQVGDSDRMQTFRESWRTLSERGSVTERDLLESMEWDIPLHFGKGDYEAVLKAWRGLERTSHADVLASVSGSLMIQDRHQEASEVHNGHYHNLWGTIQKRPGLVPSLIHSYKRELSWNHKNWFEQKFGLTPLASNTPYERTEWSYASEASDASWKSPEFDDSTWRATFRPFGAKYVDTSYFSRPIDWASDELYLRCSIELSEVPKSPVVFRGGLLGYFDVYLNGVWAMSLSSNDRKSLYAGFETDAVFSTEARRTLKPGKNYMAIYGNRRNLSSVEKIGIDPGFYFEPAEGSRQTVYDAFVEALISDCESKLKRVVSQDLAHERTLAALTRHQLAVLYEEAGESQKAAEILNVGSMGSLSVRGRDPSALDTRIVAPAFDATPSAGEYVGTVWEMTQSDADGTSRASVLSVLDYADGFELPALIAAPGQVFRFSAYHYTDLLLRVGSVSPLEVRIPEYTAKHSVVDLAPYFTHDVIANAGDQSRSPIDGDKGLLLESGYLSPGADGDRVQGLPRNGSIDAFTLGDFSGDNVIQFSKTETQPLEIAVNAGALTHLRFLLAGGNGDVQMPVTIVYTDDSAQTAKLIADDWYDDPISELGLGITEKTFLGLAPGLEGHLQEDLHRMQRAEFLSEDSGLDIMRPDCRQVIDGMHRLLDGEVDPDPDAALFEQIVTVDPNKVVQAIRFHPAEAVYRNEELGRFNLFAITGSAVRLIE